MQTEVEGLVLDENRRGFVSEESIARMKRIERANAAEERLTRVGCKKEMYKCVQQTRCFLILGDFTQVGVFTFKTENLNRSNKKIV